MPRMLPGSWLASRVDRSASDAVSSSMNNGLPSLEPASDAARSFQFVEPALLEQLAGQLHGVLVVERPQRDRARGEEPTSPRRAGREQLWAARARPSAMARPAPATQGTRPDRVPRRRWRRSPVKSSTSESTILPKPTDDHADCQVDHVALDGKFAELFRKAHVVRLVAGWFRMAAGIGAGAVWPGQEAVRRAAARRWIAIYAPLQSLVDPSPPEEIEDLHE